MLYPATWLKSYRSHPRWNDRRKKLSHKQGDNYAASAHEDKM